MFIQLYLVLAALALMPLLMAFQGFSGKKYFSYLPANLNKTTFPIDLNTTTTSSDMVLVKCPHSVYKHSNKDDNFRANIYNDIPFLEDKNSAINWFPLLKNLSGPTKINCGTIYVKNNSSNILDVEWDFNVIWNDAANAKDITKRHKARKEIEVFENYCTEQDYENIYVFTKNKTGEIEKVEKPGELTKTYINQKFYHFERVNNSEKIMVPCLIVKLFSGPPTIELPKSSLISNDTTNIFTYNTQDKQKTITVRLKVGDDESFYEGEKITLTKMRYVEIGLEVIDNSTELITSSFKIKGFELVQLTYKYEGESKWKNITKTVYFGPNANSFSPLESVAYVKNETTLRPNCTLSWKTIGYLKAVNYSSKSINIEDLNNNVKTKGKFVRRDGFVILKDFDKTITTLGCIYQTPNGVYTMVKAFYDKDKVNVDVNDGGSPFSFKITHYNATAMKKYNELEKELEESKKSWYKKLEDKVGAKYAMLIICGSILLITPIIIVLLIILYIMLLSPCIKMFIHKKKHPNVYEFWDMLSSEDFIFEKYCQDITDKKYISDKILNFKAETKIEGGEAVNVGSNDLFDGTLVNCYKNLTQKIKAHYVYTDSEKRKYILSEGPTKDTEKCFWEMIYEENIGTIVAVIYDKKEKGNNETFSKIYWPTDKSTFKDITVTFLEKKKLSALSVSGYNFKLEKKNCPSKALQIFHVGNWKENDIPQSDLQFVKMYDDIMKTTKNSNFLFHTSHGTGSRIYMLTYFACIYDAMISDNDVTDPFQIIKEIREKRYGGNVGKYEFAYVIKALVSTFFNNKILIDFSKRRSEFISNYDSYFYDFLKRQAKMDDNLKEFLNYVNIIDASKIKGYSNEVYLLGRIHRDDLPNYCKSFVRVRNIDTLRAQKIRYSDIFCLDETLVTVHGKPITDVNSFIHANKFEYTTGTDKKRKLILCQAPTKDTHDDMLDMIFRYNISIVVILVTPEEAMYKKNPKWFIYFPVNDKDILHTANYSLTRVRFKSANTDKICESEFCLVQTSSRRSFNFTILHYCGWPDKSIPPEHMTIYALYKKIMSFKTDNYIAMHCSAGIGRTGTLALIMYLIDTINMFPTFNPIARLACIRRSRYLAVQKFSQFVFSILVVFEHFKKEIEDMDPGAYKRFVDMADGILNKERETEKREEKQREMARLRKLL